MLRWALQTFALAALAVSVEPTGSRSLMHIQDTNFAQYAMEHTHETGGKRVSTGIFVMFYSKNCGHCHRFAPTWEKLSMKYNPTDGNVTVQTKTRRRVGMVECTEQGRNVCRSIGVTGYPQLFLVEAVKNESTRKLHIEKFKYTGPRELSALSSFMEHSWGVQQLHEAVQQREKQAEEHRQGLYLPAEEVAKKHNDEAPVLMVTATNFAELYQASQTTRTSWLLVAAFGSQLQAQSWSKSFLVPAAINLHKIQRTDSKLSTVDCSLWINVCGKSPLAIPKDNNVWPLLFLFNKANTEPDSNAFPGEMKQISQLGFHQKSLTDEAKFQRFLQWVMPEESELVRQFNYHILQEVTEDGIDLDEL